MYVDDVDYGPDDAHYQHVDYLIPIGTRVRCSSHVGELIAYFTAADGFGGGTTIYGVINLEEGYWTEGRKTFVRSLVVHGSNLAKA